MKEASRSMLVPSVFAECDCHLQQCCARFYFALVSVGKRVWFRTLPGVHFPRGHRVGHSNTGVARIALKSPTNASRFMTLKRSKYVYSAKLLLA